MNAGAHLAFSLYVVQTQVLGMSPPVFKMVSHLIVTQSS